MTTDLRIDSDRMLAAFDELAAIGSTGDGGVNRPTFSEAHLARTCRVPGTDPKGRPGLPVRRRRESLRVSSLRDR